MWVLFAIVGMAGLAALLLFLPVRVRFFARLSAGTSRIRLEARILGCIPARLTMRLHLLDEPYFTLLYMNTCGVFRRIPLGGGSGKQADWRKLFALRSVHATYIAGVEDDAALTAFLTGAVATAGDIALGRFFQTVSSTPLPVFDRLTLRINLEGIATLIPAKSIPILLTKKRGKHEYSRNLD